MSITMTETAGIVSLAGALLTMLVIAFIFVAREDDVRAAFKFIGVVLLMLGGIAAIAVAWLFIGVWLSGVTA